MKLEGLRVVDLSLFLPGPLATQFMADHGAEVIKVESIHEGEPNREIGAKREPFGQHLRQHLVLVVQFHASRQVG